MKAVLLTVLLILLMIYDIKIQTPKPKDFVIRIIHDFCDHSYNSNGDVTTALRLYHR